MLEQRRDSDHEMNYSTAAQVQEPNESPPAGEDDEDAREEDKPKIVALTKEGSAATSPDKKQEESD